MENLSWEMIIVIGFGILLLLKILEEVKSMRISISELIDTVKEIDAKTNYIENIQDDILALSEKLYPKDPDEWMSNV